MPSRKTLEEATLLKKQQGENSTLSFKSFNGKPKLYHLRDYLAERTESYLKERRSKLGRAYSVSNVTKVFEVDDKSKTLILLIEIKSLSTHANVKPIIGFKTLKVLSRGSKYYTQRLLLKVKLSEYADRPNLTNLKKGFKEARAMYFCNCMMFNFSGANYRAGKWSLYPQKIADPKMRKPHGSKSKVCKHLAHISIDFNGFIPEINRRLKPLIKS